MARSPFGKYLCAIVLAVLAGGSFFLGTPAHAATYNVKTYGAKGDGVHDDSPAISNAIAAASKSTGNTVAFPTGNYLIGHGHPSLAVGTSMLLQGEPNSVLKMSDASAQLIVSGNRVIIDGLSIANTGSSISSGVQFSHTTGGTVVRSTFSGWTNGITAVAAIGLVVDQNTFSLPKSETGVLVQSSSQITITNNQFNSLAPNYGYGVYSDLNINEITIKDNKFASLGYAVYAQGDPVSPLPTITSSNNTFQNCYYGYYCQNIFALYVDKDTINNSVYGVYAFYNKTLNVTNCTINSPSTYGVYMGSPSQNASVISNNTITNLTSAYGVSVSGNVSVTNNRITGAGTSVVGVYATDAGTNAIINGNTIDGALYAVEAKALHSLEVENNHISNTLSSGIYTSSDSNDRIEGNDLKDCGLSSGAYAVIYVNGFTSGNYTYAVDNNSYKAQDTANLKYFIYVNGPSQSISIKGNRTDTFLPSYPFSEP